MRAYGSISPFFESMWESLHVFWPFFPFFFGANETHVITWNTHILCILPFSRLKNSTASIFFSNFHIHPCRHYITRPPASHLCSVSPIFNNIVSFFGGKKRKREHHIFIFSFIFFCVIAERKKMNVFLYYATSTVDTAAESTFHLCFLLLFGVVRWWKWYQQPCQFFPEK